jgi:hypothetical protein
MIKFKVSQGHDNTGPSLAASHKAAVQRSVKARNSKPDPLETWWTLPMVIAWIICRDRDRVLSMLLNESSRLNLFDAIEEFSAFDRSNKGTEIELFKQLQRGDLQAWGIPKAGNVYDRIPSVMWLELRIHYENWETDDIGTRDDLVPWSPPLTNAHHTHIPPPYAPTPSYRRVRVECDKVLNLWPERSTAGRSISGRKTGRTPYFDWEEGRLYLNRLLDERGDFSENNQVDGWQSQADAENAVLTHLTKKQRSPSESLTRTHVTRIVREWRAQRASNMPANTGK